MQKAVVICFVLVSCSNKILGLSDEMQEVVDKLHKTCVDETGTDEAMIVNARKGDFADDPKFKCYFKCICDQMGCMTDDGRIDNEAIIALMPPETQDDTTISIVRGCTDVGSDPCETAWLVHKCYQRGSPKDYFLP